jgi:multidrug efflux pump subunit AcrA (membrane-fusion protein)
VLTIANLNEMIINAHINQADITRLQVGKEVEVQVEAVPGLKVQGKVERIAPQATIRNNIKGYAVRILLRDVDRRIKPGMTANVNIPVESRDNVLAVPLSAVFTERNPDTQQMERFVYIKKGERFEKQIVVVGIADFFYAEIQEGLQAGDVVTLEMPKEEMANQSALRTAAAARPPGASGSATNAAATNRVAAANTNAAGPRPAASGTGATSAR